MSHEEQLSTDPWQALESTWREPTADTLDPQEAATLGRRMVRLGHRQLWIGRAILAGELLVALLFGGQALLWLWQGSGSDRMAGVFVLSLLATVGALRRQAWRRRQPAVDAPPLRYVELLELHNREGFAALRLGRRVLAVQVLFFSFWLPYRIHPLELAPLLRTYGLLALWSLGFLLVFYLARRYLLRERQHLAALRQELGADSVLPEPGPEVDPGRSV